MVPILLHICLPFYIFNCKHVSLVHIFTLWCCYFYWTLFQCDMRQNDEYTDCGLIWVFSQAAYKDRRSRVPEKFATTLQVPEVTAPTQVWREVQENWIVSLLFLTACVGGSSAKEFYSGRDIRIETEQKALSIQLLSVHAHSFLLSMQCEVVFNFS